MIKSLNLLTDMRTLEGTHACTGVRVVLKGVRLSYLDTSTGFYKVIDYTTEQQAFDEYKTLTHKKPGRKPARKHEVARKSYF